MVEFRNIFNLQVQLYLNNTTDINNQNNQIAKMLKACETCITGIQETPGLCERLHNVLTQNWLYSCQFFHARFFFF